MQFDCYRQYLNSTNQSRVVKFTNLVTLVFHLGWLQLLTKFWKFGYIGVALAMLLTTMSNFTIVAGYTWKVEGLNPFTFSWKRVMKAKYVKVYLVLAAPSIALVCGQWWAVEILQLMATRLSLVAVGCMAISASYHSLILQIAFSLNIGATSVIGNVIGEGDSRLSKVISIVTYVEGATIYTVLSILTFTYSREIAGIYSGNN